VFISEIILCCCLIVFISVETVSITAYVTKLFCPHSILKPLYEDKEIPDVILHNPYLSLV
jgi:hypothetical protein